MKLQGTAAYFEMVVLPNYTAFQNEPTNMTAAVNVAISLNHVTDHAYREFGPPQAISSFDAFKEKVENACPAVKKLRTLANAVKHAKSQPALATNLTWSEATFPWKQAAFSWADASTALSIPSGSNDLVEVVQKAVSEAKLFWENYLKTNAGSTYGTGKP
jgi:hypothetical protein